MFEEVRNLLVVYKEKDEIALNQLKKLVDTKDDDSENGIIVGTEDGTVKIIAWNEKTWLDNKKAGNTGHFDDKILFLSDVKGVDKLIPTLDIKFNKYGVSYGFSGKQAAIIIDSKPLSKKETYDDFTEELNKICSITSVNKKRILDLNGSGIALTVLGFIVDPVGTSITVGSCAYGDAKNTRTLQLLYAVVNLYQNDLDSFMKS